MPKKEQSEPGHGTAGPLYNHRPSTICSTLNLTPSFMQSYLEDMVTAWNWIINIRIIKKTIMATEAGHFWQGQKGHGLCLIGTSASNSSWDTYSGSYFRRKNRTAFIRLLIAPSCEVAPNNFVREARGHHQRSPPINIHTSYIRSVHFPAPPPARGPLYVFGGLIFLYTHRLLVSYKCSSLIVLAMYNWSPACFNEVHSARNCAKIIILVISFII